MHLSLFSDYSLRVLMYAALKDGVFLLDEVTEAYGISRHHAGKVVHRLGKDGYLETRRGRGGGILLAREPREVRLGELVRRTEQQPVFLECFDPKTNTCPVAGACRLKGVLGEALQAFYRTLDQYTLEDLVRGPQESGLRSVLLGAALA